MAFLANFCQYYAVRILLGIKCYHMALRPDTDWLILKAYSKAIQCNSVIVSADCASVL